MAPHTNIKRSADEEILISALTFLGKRCVSSEIKMSDAHLKSVELREISISFVWRIIFVVCGRRRSIDYR